MASTGLPSVVVGEKEIFMAKLKGARVGVIKYEKGGMETDMRLDKSSMTFFAEFMGKTYANQNGEELRQEVLQAMRESETFNWQPVISLRIPEPTYRGYPEAFGVLAFGAERYYITRKMDESWIYCRFDSDPARRGELNWPLGINGEMNLPYCQKESHRESRTYYLAYSETLWQQVVRFLSEIEKSRTLIESQLRHALVPAALILDYKEYVEVS
jgi:hypothetical protein